MIRMPDDLNQVFGRLEAVEAIGKCREPSNKSDVQFT